MTAAAFLVGSLTGLGVVVALAPAGAGARWSLRGRRRGALVHPGDRRRVPASSARATASGGRWARLGPALERLGPVVERAGRGLRRLVGRPPDPAADRRVGVAAAVALLGPALVPPTVAVPIAACAWIVPGTRERSRRLAREREVRTALPDTVDLFRLAVGAGLSVHQAVEAVAAHAPPPVGGCLGEACRRVELGARLGDALDVLEELGDPALPLVAALRSAARYGSPLGSALERVAVDARVLRRRRAEEDARRLPVQLLFPLVLCVLPAFGLLAVAPLLLASLRSLQL